MSKFNKIFLLIIFSGILFYIFAFPTQAAVPQVAPIENIKMKFQVPIPGLAQTITVGGDTIGGYIKAVHRLGVAVLGILAVVMIMLGGFQWMTAAGESGKIKEAKERITYAVVGLFLGLGSFLILNTINVNLVQFKTLVLPRAQRTELVRSCMSSQNVTCGKKYKVDDKGKITCSATGDCEGKGCPINQKCNETTKKCQGGCIADGGDWKEKDENCCSGASSGEKCVSGQWGCRCSIDEHCLNGGRCAWNYCRSGRIGARCGDDDGKCLSGLKCVDYGSFLTFCAPGTLYSHCNEPKDCGSNLECQPIKWGINKLCCNRGDTAENCLKGLDALGLGKRPTGSPCFGDNCKNCESGHFYRSGKKVAGIETLAGVDVCTEGVSGSPCNDKADCNSGLVCSGMKGEYEQKYCREGKAGDVCIQNEDCPEGRCEDGRCTGDLKCP